MPPRKDRSERVGAPTTTNGWETREEDRDLSRHETLGRQLVTLIACVVALALISPWPSPSRKRLGVGDISGRSIVAEFAFAAVDRERTDTIRDSVALQAPAIHVLDPLIATRAQERFDNLLEAARRLATADVASTSAADLRRQQHDLLAAKVLDLGMAGLPSYALDGLLGLSGSDGFAEAGRSLIDEIYARGLMRNAYGDRSAMVVRNINDETLSNTIDPTQALDIYSSLGRFVTRRASLSFAPGAPNAMTSRQCLAAVILAIADQPNIVYQREATETERERRREAVAPVLYAYNAGDLIVSAGTLVTERAFLALREHDHREFTRHVYQWIGNALLTLVTLWFVSLYMARHFREIKLNATNQWLIALPILIGLALGRGALLLLSDYGDLGAYLYPSGLVGMLGVVLLGPRVATIMLAAACLLFGLMVDLRYDLTLVAVVGGLAGIVTLQSMRERKQFIIAGLAIAVANALTAATLLFMGRPVANVHADIGTLAIVAGLVNGVFCMAFVWILPPMFERVFGVVTDLRLLEITARHELLTRLEREAPGTYQHSLNVAKLAEAAADAVGANFLLVRAGAYFHDIGKMVKREYYTENQVSPEETSIHSKLTPNMSTLLIRNHVKEGVEMAQRYGLPPRVIDFIPQHHGTAIISYFYNLALRQYENSESKDPVFEDDFRYPGPRPLTPETAIMMMADAVEATSHSMFSGRAVTDDELRRIVHDTVRAQFADGQFDECHLTLRDLHLISISFVQTLRARYHHRVDYRKAKA